MKGLFFFKDKNERPVEIQEFDYNYVRNSLLKVFDKNVAKKYIFNVIVSRTYDGNGMPIFDVRPLNLNDIFFDTERLRVLEMMMDDIYFKKVSIQDLPVPKLQQEYQEFLEGRSKPVKVETPDIPAPITFTRKEIKEDDPRLNEIAKVKSTFEFKPLVVLDWVENFEVCSQEITKTNQSIAEEQMKLVQILQNNSDYIHGVFNNLTTVLEGMFPLKPTFMQRMFNYSKDVEVKQEDLGTILSTLHNAVAVDPHRFSGISTVFKEIQENINTFKDSVEHGIVGCTYAITSGNDTWNEFEMRQERLMKIRATTDISELSLSTIHKKFISDLNKLKEVQEVVVPLLIIKLQNQASKKVDDETVDIIRNLAYRKNNDFSANAELSNEPAPPPKNP